MTKINTVNLKEYLGVWHKDFRQAFAVVPNPFAGEKEYRIIWRNSSFPITIAISTDKTKLQSIGCRWITVDSEEAFRRLVSKIKLGYTLVSAYAGEVPLSANTPVPSLTDIQESIRLEKEEYIRRIQSRREMFSDWLLDK